MKLIRIIVIVLATFIVQEVSYGNSKEPTFNKLTIEQGLSHSTVYTITQDQKGFIWIGTREGLNRYDSYEIQTYYADPQDTNSLSSSRITSLLAGKNGTLYIGTSRGLNLYSYEDDLIQQIRFKNQDIGLVNDLFEASDHSIYICTTQGLFVLDKRGKLKQLTKDAPAISITEYKKDEFWLATSKNIVLINQAGEIIKFYPYLKKTKKKLISTEDNVSSVYKDMDGVIWIGTVKNGVYTYIPEKDIFEPIIPDHKENPIEVNVVKTLGEDHKGNIWIGTESGLFIYNKRSKEFSHYSQSFDNSAHALNDKAIYSIYRSKENIMWLGTYFGGVNFIKPKEKGFYKLKPDGGEKALSGKAISQIIKDKQGKLWIATEDGGVNIFDKTSGAFQYHKHMVNNSNSISCNNVHALQDDEKGNIWIGTLLGGLNKYNIKDQKFSTYKSNPDDTTSVLHNNIFSILKDSRGNLWVGTWKGVNIYNYEKDSFSKFETENFSGKFIFDMLEDDQGNIWFCTRNSGLYFYDVKKKKISHYYTSNKAQGLTSNSIICAFQDSKQRLWFGSLNGGLIGWDAQTNKFSAITKREGLPNNNVYGILEDDKGNLWVSTNKGLAKYNPETKEINSFDKTHGILNHQFNFKSFYKDVEGWMYFGTVNGLYYFHPDSLIFNDIAPSLHFTDFKLFNKSIRANESTILAAHIDEVEEIKLNYEQNVITFEFLATNYFSPGNNKFSYYLEGFEEEWSAPAKRRIATYTNLSPGTYTFHAKAANNDGVWSDEKRVEIVVMPPIWLSNWAKVAYFFLVVLLILLYRWYLNKRHQEKMVLQLERVEKEKMKELNQHKLNFFTYISHEFKTPLTLIIASIEKFLNKGKLFGESYQEFHLIRRNATRLHFLIDQLMEFRRVETDHANLSLNKGDVILFLQDTFFAFIPLFSRKNIDYNFVAGQEQFLTYFDADKLEKILTNLLSNAIKNTQEFGEISMDVQITSTEGSNAGNPCLQISLRDTGIGLFEGEAEKVFLPFYQGKQEKRKATGSGIGLALVKSLISYLNGSIHIESTLEKGTTISINLPCYNSPMDSAGFKIIDGNKSLLIDQDLFHEEELEDKDSEKKEAGGFELMIVEDNKELLKFLVDYFSGSYKVSYARDGQAALEKLQKCIPDIIISDVIMPELDGITLCEKVKSNLNTSHIPVILLTAKSTTDHKLKGLDVGADAYLPKPFNLKELELMVKNFLDSKNNLKKHFLKFGSLNSYDKPINNKDQDFINKLTGIVHQFLDDPELNISTFTREAGISRSLLHLKLKKLVNLNASGFIKAIRLQKAAELLKEGFAVYEVAYKVGFKNPTYFSRSFKEKYNLTPIEYKENECHTSTEEAQSISE